MDIALCQGCAGIFTPDCLRAGGAQSGGNSGDLKDSRKHCQTSEDAASHGWDVGVGWRCDGEAVP